MMDALKRQPNNMDKKTLPLSLSNLDPELIAKILAVSVTKEIPKDTEIVREGQFSKVIPFVLKGLIRVYTRYEDKELLLYYIRPNESCVMSFSSSIKNEPSKVFATTEQDTTVLLIPVNKVTKWIKHFPDINTLFFQQYNLRYSELLDTIQHMLVDKMVKRLLDYLNEKIALTNQNPLFISHRQIAEELGTAREVISRKLKRLENEGKLKQHAHSIELL